MFRGEGRRLRANQGAQKEDDKDSPHSAARLEHYAHYTWGGGYELAQGKGGRMGAP